MVWYSLCMSLATPAAMPGSAPGALRCSRVVVVAESVSWHPLVTVVVRV